MHIKEKNGKKILSMTKTEWQNIGKQAGIWDKAKGAWQGAVEGWKGQPQAKPVAPPAAPATTQPNAVQTPAQTPVAQPAQTPATPQQEPAAKAHWSGLTEEEYKNAYASLATISSRSSNTPEEAFKYLSSLEKFFKQHADSLQGTYKILRSLPGSRNEELHNNARKNFIGISQILSDMAYFTGRKDLEKSIKNFIDRVINEDQLDFRTFNGQFTADELVGYYNGVINILKEIAEKVKNLKPIFEKIAVAYKAKQEGQLKSDEDNAKFFGSSRKIKISQSQWKNIGKKAGWIK